MLCAISFVFSLPCTSILSCDVQVTNALLSRLRADSTFFVKKACNGRIQFEYVKAVTLSISRSPRVCCGKFLERPFPDAVGLVLQHDLRRVNVVSLHVIQAELEKHGHGIGVLDALGD